jgi:predicted GH43/DUF377 family glycosyl hydrolase
MKIQSVEINGFDQQYQDHSLASIFDVKIINAFICKRLRWQDHRWRHLRDTAMLWPDNARLGGACPSMKIEKARESL